LLLDQISDEEEIKYILTKKKEYGSEKTAELLFPYAIKSGSLPDQIDETFVKAIIQNDDYFFYLVVLTLEMYKECFTTDRLQAYIYYCVKYRKKKYYRILDDMWSIFNTNYYCNSNCNYCFLYNMIPKRELCTCSNEPPKIYLGMEL
jgi:hypothetical protein